MDEVKLVYGILSIVGVFGTLALAVNAFFLKGIYDRLGTVEVAQGAFLSNQNNNYKRIIDLQQAQKETEIELSRARDRIHKLEGSVDMLTAWTKEG